MSQRIIYFLLILLSIVRCASSSISATEHLRRGDQYNNQNNYASAISEYQAYIEMVPSLGLYRNPLREAEVYRKLAQAYTTQGNYVQASDYLLKALAIDTEQEGNQLSVIVDYRMSGLVKMYQGDHQEALTNLQKAIELSEHLDSSKKSAQLRTYADTQLALAQVYFSMSHYKEAEVHSKKAEAIYQKITDEQGSMETSLLLGTIYLVKDQWERAKILTERSLLIGKRLDVSLSRQYQVLSDILFAMGDLEQAMEYRLLSLEQAEQSGIIPQIIWMNLKTGDGYEWIGDTEKAQEYYQRAGEIQSSAAISFVNPSLEMRLGNVEEAYRSYVSGNAELGIALSEQKLGELALQEGNDSLALVKAMKSKERFTTLGSKEGEAQCYILISKIAYLQGDINGSLDALTKALHLTSQPELQWQIEYLLAQSYHATLQDALAITHAKQSIEIIEGLRGSFKLGTLKSRYFASKIEVYDHLIQLLIEEASTSAEPKVKSELEAEAFVYAERARARNYLDMLGNRMITAKSPNDSTMLIMEQELRLRLSDKKQQENNKQWEEDQSMYADLIQELSKVNPSYSSLLVVDPPTLQEIQGSIPEETVFINYWLGASRSFAWIIGHHQFHMVELPINIEKLKLEIGLSRNLIRYQLEKELREISHRLYEELITPVQPYLENYQQLCIIPHGPLHFLPFQTLISSENRYLIDDYIIFYNPSISSFYLNQNKEADGNNNILGMALGNLKKEGFTPLPSTREEVEHIAQLYNGMEIYIAEQSKESVFKSRAGDFGIFHLASHGILNKNQPFESYILLQEDTLEDGHLKVDEIFEMDMNARTIILSACETGIGEIDDGDELVGLSRSLLYAGSSSIVASLWAVDDFSTSLFMIKLHQYLASGKSIAEAVSLTQRDMIHLTFTNTTQRGIKSLHFSEQMQQKLHELGEKPTKHPYYWAAFIVIGNGAVTIGG